MIDILRDQLDRLYKKQSTLLRAVGIVSIGSIILDLVLEIFIDLPLIADLLIIAVFPLIFIAAVRKDIIPENNASKNVNEVMTYLKKDFTSDNAVNVLYTKIGAAATPVEKIQLICLLSDVYHFRDELQNSIALLNSVDRSVFRDHPSVGLTFYGEITGIYEDVGDYDSVLRAYNDAEPFIEECCRKNYILCSGCVSIMSVVYKASGDYKKALELHDLRSSYRKDLAQKTGNEGPHGFSSPLQRAIYACELLSSAELYYLNGMYDMAAQAVDTAGPMVTDCPNALRHANELSAKLRAR